MGITKNGFELNSAGKTLGASRATLAITAIMVGARRGRVRRLLLYRHIVISVLSGLVTVVVRDKGQGRQDRRRRYGDSQYRDYH